MFAAIGLVPCCMVGVAWALPAVTFRAEFVPVAGFAGTGGSSGEGAALEAEYGITGAEYDESPPPLIGFSLFLPVGVILHPAGFPTCPQADLQPAGMGPSACPKGSSAGRVGEALGFVTLAGERVHEKTTIESFYSEGGGLEFYTAGHLPVPLEILSSGHYANLNGGEGYGPRLVTAVPLVASLPGAPDVSFGRIDVTVGSAYESRGETTYYATLPSSCPDGYLPFKAELTFAGLEGLTQTTITKEYRAPCPSGEASAPLQEAVPGTGGVVTAPSNATCISRRDFRIHIRQIGHREYRRVTVDLNGTPVRVLRGARNAAPIDLRGLPKGRYVVRITVLTSTGRTVTGTYHTCAAKPIHPKGTPTL
jgi:hypothetical protein